jgi:hypothetical protein
MKKTSSKPITHSWKRTDQNMDTNEITPVDPTVTIPASPAARLTEEHHQKLKTFSKAPIFSFILIALVNVIGAFNSTLIPVLSLISLFCAVFTVVCVVFLMVFVIRARKQQQKVLDEAVYTATPLLAARYKLDATPELVSSLMSGAALTLKVDDELTKVQLLNVGQKAVLVHAASTADKR